MDHTTPTTVFWDYENCGISPQKSAKACQNICRAIRNLGYHGDVSFKVYANVGLGSNPTLTTMAKSGMDVLHIDTGRKNAADIRMCADMLIWSTKTRPPAIVFLISGDKDFDYVLRKLVLGGYKVFIASGQPSKSEAPVHAFWKLDNLLRGEDPYLLNESQYTIAEGIDIDVKAFTESKPPKKTSEVVAEVKRKLPAKPTYAPPPARPDYGQLVLPSMIALMSRGKLLTERNLAESLKAEGVPEDQVRGLLNWAVENFLIQLNEPET